MNWIRNESARMDWVQRKIDAIPAGSRVLDAGAGEQRLRPLCKHLSYVAQDYGGYAPAQNNAGLQMQQWDYGKLDIVSDITSIPEPDGSFDAVICMEVLEHVPDPLAAIRELSRLIKPNGSLILTAPFCSLTHFAPHHHATGFSRFYYETWLPKCGLAIQEITPIGSFFQFLGQELQRLPQVCERYGKSARLLDRLITRGMLNILAAMEQHDRGSSELLCFGFLVHAVKT
jgi:ubiquinone/menaquinone biosynthesis C-methylase UbiE